MFAMEVIARFWSKVAVGRSNQCWLWGGARDRWGYGEFKIAGSPKRAHRVAYEIATMQPLPSTMLVLHTCDTPACCNPRHLFEGTDKTNADDREAKGRAPRDHGRYAPLGNYSSGS